MSKDKEFMSVNVKYLRSIVEDAISDIVMAIRKTQIFSDLENKEIYLKNFNVSFEFIIEVLKNIRDSLLRAYDRLQLLENILSD